MLKENKHHRLSRRDLLSQTSLQLSGLTENSVLPSVLAVTTPYDVNGYVLEYPFDLFEFHSTHLLVELPILVPDTSNCHQLLSYAEEQSPFITVFKILILCSRIIQNMAVLEICIKTATALRLSFQYCISFFIPPIFYVLYLSSPVLHTLLWMTCSNLLMPHNSIDVMNRT